MSKILQRVESEYKLSKNTFETWREKKADQFKIMFDATKTGSKVNINLFAAQHSALIALSYADELTVKYEHNWIEDEEVAENKEIIAKNDFYAMWMDKTNYQKQSDRITYNVAIRLLEWDEKKNMPHHTILDPMTWYADPNPTWFSGNDYRWHWFETETTVEELEALWYDTSRIDLDEPEDTHNTDSKRKEYLWQEKQKEDTPNKKVYIYTHFTNINWIWTKVVCDSWFTTVFENEPCDYEPWEKENKCPVILNFFKPVRWSAIGWECPLDMLEAPQRASTKLFNLQLAKATREALGWDFIYDPDIIKNAAQLESRKEGRRYIKAQAGNRWLGNAMMELPSSRLTVDVENMRASLLREWQAQTWVDSVIQWTRSDQNITARESQTIQSNANLNLALNNRVDMWGEKDFWEYVDRLYKIHFDEAKKKIAKLSVWFGSKIIQLDKKDFTSTSEIDIRIVNKSDKLAQMEKEKLSIPYYQQEANNPNNAKIIQLFFRRKIARLSWMSPDEVKMITYDYVEEKAKEQVALLNRGKEIKDIDPAEDQMTYLIIYKRAIDSEAKDKAIEIRQRLLEEQLKKKITWQWEWMDKMLNNQMMANSMSEQRKWTEAVSTQDIAQI